MAAARALETQIVAATEKARPAVVAVARIRKAASGPNGFARLERLLKPSVDGADSFAPAELGTGVIVDGRGLVLTTCHSLSGVKDSDYAVWFERRAWPAKIRAADPWFDLALLEVDADDWPMIEFAPAADAKPGQFAILLGNPFAIARDGRCSSGWGSITNVRVPLPHRDQTSSEQFDTLHDYGTLLETNARIEGGATSGGVMVDLQGQMIGLATSSFSRAGAERLGALAIPADEHFKRTLAALKEGRVPNYGFLGIAPAALVGAEQVKDTTGILVSEVIPCTPAARIGLHAGDVLISIDGEPLNSDDDLTRMISRLHATDAVSLKVARAGDRSRNKATSFTVSLTKKPVPAKAVITTAPQLRWRGLQVDYATVSPRFREAANALDPAGCLGVIAVERDSPAWKAGFRPGDFISHVSGKRVTTPDEFFDAVADVATEIELQSGVGNTVRVVPATP